MADAVVAWGAGEYGQMAVPFEAQSGVKAIAAGGLHTVVVDDNCSFPVENINCRSTAHEFAHLPGRPMACFLNDLVECYRHGDEHTTFRVGIQRL